jgi:hypothetical protein
VHNYAIMAEIYRPRIQALRDSIIKALPRAPNDKASRDVAIDGGYQFLGDGTHIATVDGIFTHEDQNLKAFYRSLQI